MTYHKIERPKNLVEEVSSQIEKRIRSRELKESDKLPSENKLCNQFNVSRVVVREAMSNLQAKKLIVTYRGKGSFVANPENYILDESDASSTDWDTAGGQGALTLENLQEFFEFRQAIETTVVKLVCKRRETIDWGKCTAALQKMKDTVGDAVAFSNADYDFHFSLVEATDNQFLIQSFKACRALVVHCLQGMNKIPGSHEWGVETHTKILKATKDGDWKTAIDLITGNDDYNLVRMIEFQKK